MKYDIIVIGGGPAGIISAITAKKYKKNKKILLIKDIGKGVIPCAIPYMLKTLKEPEDNIMGDASLEKNEIDIKVDEVIEIDKEKKTIQTKKRETIEYDKLVIATGSNPVIPPIKGIDKKGVYPIKKSMDYLKKMKKEINKSKNIVIIGGGFIGIEFADELSKTEGRKITLIECLPEILTNSFDKEFSQIIHQKLTEQGIDLMIGTKAEEIKGNDKVKEVITSENKKICADAVILGIGATPNSSLAQKAGLKTGERKEILVDEYLRTSDKNIFAAGDCAEKKDFLTKKKTCVMLASTATAEARTIGTNITEPEQKNMKKDKGTIATYSTKIGDVILGSAGTIEKTAVKEGIDIITGKAECPDKHPGKMPSTNQIKLKMVFTKKTGTLIGGQIAGGETAGEIINVIGLAIQKKMTATELETIQIATHPKLTAAPTVYPIITAAQDALSKYKQ